MKGNQLTSSRSVGMREFPSPLVGEGARKAGEGCRFGFTLKCHAESSLLSISTAEKTQGRDPEQKPFGMALCKGFTFIELLIVVLIIGILSAIAVPQYQKAVLKSRFSSLMPTTKSIRDGNEMYYMTNGRYADDIAKLDVTTANTDDMTLTVSDDMDYAYTMATRPNISNNLIMYQKHSGNFPGEIHCEALEGNSQAEWLCATALHGTPVNGSVTEGYNTYILEGTGSGLFGGSYEAPTCDKALAMGYTCELTTDTDGNVTQKKVCSEDGVCSVIDYNENGYKRTTCQLNASNVCETKWEHTYDANGNKTSELQCQTVAADGSCTEYVSGFYYSYDANGNQISQRYCSTFASDGSCTEYASSGGYDYTYDANGNLTSQLYCKTVAADGSCTEYDVQVGSHNKEFTYDEDGNMTSTKQCRTWNSTKTECMEWYTVSYN